ncbi:hypothetical protein CHARACLAT_027985, partial [Characodon lateralis]|nr:hypothetical protein [Characodon lateralis]
MLQQGFYQELTKGHTSLLPCSEKVLGSTPGQGSFCMAAWSVHVLPVHAWVLTGYSNFLPLSKDMTVRLTGLSKLPLGVCLSCMSLCCPVMEEAVQNQNQKSFI